MTRLQVLHDVLGEVGVFVDGELLEKARCKVREFFAREGEAQLLERAPPAGALQDVK